MKVNPHRSSLGMDANIMALLCYLAAFVLGWIPIIQYVAFIAPLVIFFIEKESPFVKFHAMQAFILQAVNFVFMVVFGIIISAITAAYISSGAFLRNIGAAAGGAVVFSTLLIIIGVILTIFAIIAMVKAHGYFEYKIPVVGNLAEKFSKKNMPR
ncbi:MAG: DUF4870 domain-containing protein [Clostridiales bacterium]|jgi:uncharacterized membrane protein|nr:DUF4870 domain-containing protein [Clostridiales bacterium]